KPAPPWGLRGQAALQAPALSRGSHHSRLKVVPGEQEGPQPNVFPAQLWPRGCPFSPCPRQALDALASPPGHDMDESPLSTRPLSPLPAEQSTAAFACHDLPNPGEAALDQAPL
ncbi:hypothetical protein H1C71_011788, partial [Ictidomys tridecemlineatus]